nr:hypothetical protein [Escherichia coli]
MHYFSDNKDVDGDQTYSVLASKVKLRLLTS